MARCHSSVDQPGTQVSSLRQCTGRLTVSGSSQIVIITHTDRTSVPLFCHPEAILFVVSPDPVGLGSTGSLSSSLGREMHKAATHTNSRPLLPFCLVRFQQLFSLVQPLVRATGYGPHLLAFPSCGQQLRAALSQERSTDTNAFDRSASFSLKK